jgi:hypothetical protein
MEQGCQIGIFLDQKSIFWYILEGLGAKIFGLFYAHVLFFKLTFTYICGHLDIFWALGIYFPRFGMLYREKSGSPGTECVLAAAGKAFRGNLEDTLARKRLIEKKCS